MEKTRLQKILKKSTPIIIGIIISAIVGLFVLFMIRDLRSAEIESILKKDNSFVNKSYHTITNVSNIVENNVNNLKEILLTTKTDTEKKEVLEAFRVKYGFEFTFLNLKTVNSSGEIKYKTYSAMGEDGIYDPRESKFKNYLENIKKKNIIVYRDKTYDKAIQLFSCVIYDDNNEEIGYFIVGDDYRSYYANYSSSFKNVIEPNILVDMSGDIISYEGMLDSGSEVTNFFKYLSTVSIVEGSYDRLCQDILNHKEGYVIVRDPNYKKCNRLIVYEFSPAGNGSQYVILRFHDEDELHANSGKIILYAFVLCFILGGIISMYIMRIYRKNKDVQKRIEKFAYMDMEFDIYNMNYLKENIRKYIKRGNTMYAYMSLDIDNFKYVNSVIGYDKGLKVLAIFVENLKEEFNRNEIILRENGDVFGVLAEFTTKEELVDRIESVFARTRHIVYDRHEHILFLGFSVGINIIEEHNHILQNIVDGANYARKDVKEIVEQSIKFFDTTIEQRFIDQRDYEREMKKAIEDSEFKVYLQPKMNMVTAQLCGAEALVRWEHGKKGMIYPDKFIPQFEKTGFIIQLDNYMFEEVCKLKKKWREEGMTSVRISVNMSRLHLHSKDFVGKLVAIAYKYDIDPNELEIEITENLFLEDLTLLADVAKQIKDAGFWLSVDDFGAGYSSLNMLKDIPVDVIKLDREFLAKSEYNDKSKKIIKNVIAMAKDLKMEIVSEGVETLEQAELLMNYGCYIAQGYYYSRPICVSEFETFAEEHGKKVDQEYVFEFNDNLEDTTGVHTAKVVGEDVSYIDGPIENMRAVNILGGAPDTNVITIPPSVLSDESYTIAFWVKADKFLEWQALMYIEYDTGFMEYLPLSITGMMTYRIKDDEIPNGWFDTRYSAVIKSNQWYHLTLTYNAKTEVCRIYVNGEPVGYRNGVPTLHGVEYIYLGGTVYQPSEACAFAQLIISDVVKSPEEVMDLYMSVKSKMK